MCEFCTKHGEGKKWYFQMKNYSHELIHHELSLEEKKAVKAETRAGWLKRFFDCFISPAATGRTEEKTLPSEETAQPEVQMSKEEILRRQKIVHYGQVIPIEDVEQVLDKVNSITRLPCGCRYITTGKTDKRYCFGLGYDKWGILGKYPDPSTSLEVLEKEKAKELFRAFDKEGLMHSIWTGVTPYIIGICNCDHDCAAYREYIEDRGLPTFFRAEYVCQVDWDACSGCKSCMQQCQFGAMFYSSSLVKVHIDPTRCFGCGVCRTACPSDAIALLPRGKVPQAANLW